MLNHPLTIMMRLKRKQKIFKIQQKQYQSHYKQTELHEDPKTNLQSLQHFAPRFAPIRNRNSKCSGVYTVRNKSVKEMCVSYLKISKNGFVVIKLIFIANYDINKLI